MAATAAQVARIRRMTNEPTETVYDDDLVTDYIEAYPLVDARGEVPWVESTTTPGTLEENPDWTATYDLAAAAADIWAEKASSLAGDYDFAADGGNYSRSQAYEQAMKSSRYWRARRSAVTMTMVPVPLAQGTELLDD